MSAVNGVNGHKNGGQDILQWKVGLINSAGKYLTAETFGFKVNASGTTLKKKQTWTLEQDTNVEALYIRSHLGKYIATDSKGNVTCEADERGDQETQFAVEYAKDGTGRWAFKNIANGYYLSGSEDNVRCFAKAPTDKELWVVQLSIHPQVSLRNVNRKRYAHLKDDQLQVTEVVPWGAESLIILHFSDGKYSLKSYDNRFLHRGGDLQEELTEDAMYSLEIRSGSNCGLAFKDCTGCYLTAVGSTATMKGRNKTVTKDELFTIEDSHPQVVLVSAQNGKKVSVKQGVDVSANQTEEEISEKEIFQLEFDRASSKWAFLMHQNKYWTVDPGTQGIQAVSMAVSDKTLFEVEWVGDGQVALKACNGSYVGIKPNGHLYAASDSVGDKERFKLRIVNRPLLIVKTDFGFVGTKSSGEVICNKSTYEIMYLEGNEDGTYKIKGQNGKYWALTEDMSVYSNGAPNCPGLFTLEFLGSSQLVIKAPNGCYLKGEQNGIFRAVGHEVEPASTFEF